MTTTNYYALATLLVVSAITTLVIGLVAGFGLLCL